MPKPSNCLYRRIQTQFLLTRNEILDSLARIPSRNIFDLFTVRISNYIIATFVLRIFNFDILDIVLWFLIIVNKEPEIALDCGVATEKNNCSVILTMNVKK